ncbi:MAG: hypothetical protein BZY87_01370 [SAR202 cluster bacterium Io17-Chloro-G6]|nr:MAG: hypothetical protein BZY87_01370 [SAR202 cluster bacterium Io17-Chloro-G6]
MTAEAPVGNSGFNVIRTTPIRRDSMDRVTGHARYGTDVTLPGLLHDKILRSSHAHAHAHAKIWSIDPAKALALPGVKNGGDLRRPALALWPGGGRGRV